MADFIKDKIFNYGTAITLGVFIGSALTTGILCGAGTYYIITKNVITNLISPIKNIIPNKFENISEDSNIQNITIRLNKIEHDIKIIKINSNN